MHTSSEPTIIEVSESEVISGTEAISTTETINSEASQFDELSLDGLFAELKQAGHQQDPTDEFSKIKQSVDSLPKIQDTLQLRDSKKNVEIISDPIVYKAKVAKKEDAGDKWFNMAQPEITPGVKRDLLIIKQRNALDPKRHYKKDKWEVPKFFQMGTLVEGNTEFYSRLKRKERGKTLVDELLHNDDSQKYFKRKYSEIQQAKTSGGKAHYKKVKSMRKKF